MDDIESFVTARHYALTQWGRGVFLGVTHALHPKGRDITPSQFEGFSLL